MAQNCPKCNYEQKDVHFCRERRPVVDPVAYVEAVRTSNPLDRLTLGDMITIYGGDTAEAIRLGEEWMTRGDERYFRGLLTYRIEFDPVLVAPGFRPDIEGFAILVDGRTDEDWDKALEFVREKRSPFTSPREGETYQCRLVSHDDKGSAYLWDVKKLEHEKALAGSFWKCHNIKGAVFGPTPTGRDRRLACLTGWIVPDNPL